MGVGGGGRQGFCGGPLFAVGWSLRVAVYPGVGALEETGRTLFELLRSFAGCRLEGLNRLALLTIDGDRVVTLPHLLLFIAASKYEDGPGDLLAAMGELLPIGLPTLVKLLLLHYV